MSLLNKNTLLSFALLAAAAACGGDDGPGGPDKQPDLNPDGTHTTYVINELTVPDSGAAATAVALDIDGEGRRENALGSLLGALETSANLGLQGGVDEQIADGTLVLLASVKATDLVNASGVGTFVFFGENASPAPCTDPNNLETCGQHLNGTGSFDITSGSPTDAYVAGELAGGSFVGGPGTVTIELPITGEAPLRLELVSARMELDINGTTGLMNGKLGGALREEDVNSELIPAVLGLIEGIIEEDCPNPSGNDCNCTKGSGGAQVLSFFDTGYKMCIEENPDGSCKTFSDTVTGAGDCKVELAEVNSNSIIDATLQNPDLDLFDETGAYNPNKDGVKDSLSLGVGFSAVSGTFTVPAGI